MLLLLLACAPAPADSAADPAPTCTERGPWDDELTMAEVQSLGTHNSYHVEPEVVVDTSHAYTQPPLDEQADLGVRQFELDVHLTDAGEFAVFHLPELDPESTCPTLAGCLGTLRAWSDAHVCHVPFTVWLEPKDDLDGPAAGLQPLAGHLAELDAAILDVWPRSSVIAPDDVRGEAATLAEGVGAGWPSLADARGKVLFALLDSGEARAEYLSGAPSLEERLLFVDSDAPEDPFAATFKIDDAAADAAVVEARVAAGFLVTSNVDAAGEEDATNEAALQAALAASPHNLASDHVVAQGDSSWVAALPGGSPRCNPARTALACSAADLEPATVDAP